MKLSKIVMAMGLGMTLVSGMANATDSGSGKVKFTGTIIDAPCSISPESVDQTVALGAISNSMLANGGKSEAQNFSIDLQGCDAATKKTVTAKWSGTEDANQVGAFGLGSVTGAGLVLADASGKEIAPGTESAATSLIDGQNQISMSAFIRGDGASSTVSLGDFETVTTFALAYQ